MKLVNYIELYLKIYLIPIFSIMWAITCAYAVAVGTK